MKVVIIGGVAGGASAAARLRRLDEQAEIVILERSGYISYANCGLPYFVGGVIEKKEKLTLQTPASFGSRFRIDARVHHEVRRIDREKKLVSGVCLDTGEAFEESYDKLILSPGARPLVPPFSGLDTPGIFTLRTVEDTFRIHSFVETEGPRSAVVIGGGFIGLEMAENLREKGLAVTLVEKAPQLLPPFDQDMACFVQAKFREKGVKLLLNAGVTGFEKAEKGLRVLIDNHAPLTADLALMAIGVTPDSGLAKEAGLEIGIKGSIRVNAHMQTSDPDIYAVGDAVEIQNALTGQPGLIPLAGPANKQGRIAADCIAGMDSAYPGTYGASILKIFDWTAASVGLNERAAQAAGLAYEKVVLSPASHASYYPGGQALTMKVLYEKGSLRLLGAQIVGQDGVDKRIDVLSCALQAGVKATKLKELELAYAPPYSSAKDPVNMAGFIIENLEKGLLRQFHMADLDALPKDGSATLLDVRSKKEYDRGHAEGFRSLPLEEIRARIGEIEKGKPVYLMCQSALRSYIACRILSQLGYRCFNFSGGYRFYSVIHENRLTPAPNTSCGAPIA